MKHVLITGANSFIGTNVERWLEKTPDLFVVDTVDTRDGNWKKTDFSRYDTVFHVAGIAHVDPKPEMAPLYYKVNTDLALEVADWAKQHGVRQFIYMSSKIVYHTSRSLKDDFITSETHPDPNDFYGDSKLKAEEGLRQLETPDFKVCILRPPVIYGLNSKYSVNNKGNIPKLAWLALKTPVFPAWHNKRSALFIDNLSEFVKQIILRNMSGTFFPQNSEYLDTVEVVGFFARKYGKRIWISPLFNPLVLLGARFLKPVSKMFASSCYDQAMSRYDFDYNVVSLEESLQSVVPYRHKR